MFSYIYVKINEYKCARKRALFKLKKNKTRVVSCTCMCERYYIYVFASAEISQGNIITMHTSLGPMSKVWFRSIVGSRRYKYLWYVHYHFCNQVIRRRVKAMLMLLSGLSFFGSCWIVFCGTSLKKNWVSCAKDTILCIWKGLFFVRHWYINHTNKYWSNGNIAL